MVEAEHARRRLRAAAEHLVQTVHDVSLPHPVQTVLAETDVLAAVVDDIAARFPPRAGVLPRTPAPPPAPSADFAEAVEEEQLLLATATAHPADIESVRWLVPEDFAQPLHAGLWQCLSTLARRHEPVDPVTVLWEAQQRVLLDDGSKPGEVLRLLAEPAGSVEHWGERTLQRSLLATADHAGRRIEAYACDPANTPFQLVVGARRALADLGAIRTRWQHATGRVPPQRPRPALARRPPRPTAPPEQPDNAPSTPVAGPEGPATGRRDHTQRAPTPSIDAHVRLDTHPTHPSAVTAVLTGSQAHIPHVGLEAADWTVVAKNVLVLVRIDHEEPYWAEKAAQHLAADGIAVEITPRLREAMDEEWTWANFPCQVLLFSSAGCRGSRNGTLNLTPPGQAPTARLDLEPRLLFAPTAN